MKNIFRFFNSSQQGSVLPFIAIGIGMLTAATGTAIDMGRVELVKSRMQAAIDTSGLAIISEINSISSNQIDSENQKYFYANFPPHYLGTSDIVLSVKDTSAAQDGSKYTLTAYGTVPPAFMQIMGVQPIPITVNSVVNRLSQGMELALVIDNTGSMNDTTGDSVSKLDAAKAATKSLLNAFYGNKDLQNNLYVAVVPFSQAVNIGKTHSDWLLADKNDFGPVITYNSGKGKCPTYEDAYQNASYGSGVASNQPYQTCSQYNLHTYGLTTNFNSEEYSDNWSGCVESRSNGYNQTPQLDISETPPSNDQTKFKRYYYPTSWGWCYQDQTKAAKNGYNDWKQCGNPDSATGATSATCDAGWSAPDCSAPNSTTNPTGCCPIQATTPDCCIGYTEGCTADPVLPPGVSCHIPKTPSTTYWTTSTCPTSNFNASNGACTSGWHAGTSGSQPKNNYYTLYYYNWFEKVVGLGCGPNMGCPAQPIQPLVASKSTIINAINNMTAGGDTHIDLGLAWGWRVLSEKWQGKWGDKNLPLPYNTALMQRVVILLTDGDNSVVGGLYTAYGLQGLDNPSQFGITPCVATSTSAVNRYGADCSAGKNELDNRTLAVCNAMKADPSNIIIYTIALGTAVSTTGQSILQQCATDSSHYFWVQHTTDLDGVFHKIADSLSNLRVAQ